MNKNLRRKTTQAASSSWLSRLSHLSSWKIYALISVIVIGIYGQSISFHFVDFDDTVLTRNSRIAHLSDIPHLFVSTPSPDTYRPLLFASIALNAGLFGQTSSAAYHGLNLVLHGIVCCLVVAFVVQCGGGRLIAFWSGVLFAVHPLATQAVVWIPGRNDTLLALFTLASLLSLLRYSVTQARYWILLHGIFFWCALLTKETAVVIPILVAAYLWFVAPQPRRALFIVGLCVMEAIMIGLYAMIRSTVPLDGTLHSALRPETLLRDDVLIGLAAVPNTWQFIPESIGKMLLPIQLSGYARYSMLGLIIGGCACVLLMMGVLLFFKRTTTVPALKTNAFVLYGLGVLWLIAFLLPPMFRYDGMRDYDYLEHRAYCSLIGLALCCAAVLMEITTQSDAKTTLSRTMILCAMCSVGFGTGTIYHSRRFENATSFWQHAVSVAPSSATAHSALANVLLRNNAPMPTIEPLYRKAVEIEPTNVRYLNTLAAIHVTQGRFDEAEQELSRALAIDSSNADVAYNLGYTVRKKYGDAQLPKAVALFKRAIALQPTYQKAYAELLVTLINAGDIQQAREYYRQAVKSGVNVERSIPNLRQYIE